MPGAFIAGPFVLAKESGKLPPGLITVSTCLADMAPDGWAIEWVLMDEGERLASAAAFGIAPALLPEAIRWATSRFGDGGFGWPNVFLDLEAAREFRRLFVTAPVRLLQMSLPAELAPAFVVLTAPPPQQPGFAPTGSIGAHDAVARGLALADEGERRGHEVLGFDGTAAFDSFRCNGLEDDFERRLGIRFNKWGLIDDLEDAARCAELANGPDVSTCAVAWHPWLITEHAL